MWKTKAYEQIKKLRNVIVNTQKKFNPTNNTYIITNLILSFDKINSIYKHMWKTWQSFCIVTNKIK
jgi:hypothetical protein